MGRTAMGTRFLGLAAVGGLAAGAVAAGSASGASAPAPLPKKTVGFLQITSASEVARRIEVGAKAGAKALGWKYVSCDAKGDPTKMAACGDNLIRQKVSVILSDGIEPAVVKTPMKKAKAAKIPWIGVGGRG